jgi:hypothetical protein
MRIFNKLGHTCFFPYAGSGRRGINLKTQEQSPELPIERVNHPSLQSDLKRARIGVMLSPADKGKLRSMVDAETMELLEGAKTPEKPESPAEPLGKQMDARVPEGAVEITEEADATYEAGGEEEKVDAVKEELEARTDMMSDEGKKEELDKLADSDQPSVAAAAEELKEEETPEEEEPVAPAEEPEEEPVAPAEEPEEPEEEPEAPAEEPEEEPVAPATPAKAPKQKTYKGIAKPKLFSTCLEREIPATPDMGVKDLRKLLIEDDKKAQG